MYYYTDVINHLCGKPNSNTHLKLIRGSDTLEKKVLRTPIPNYNYILISDKNFPNESLNDYKKAVEFYDAIYPDSVNVPTICEHGIRYMLEQLDPHSTYISLEDIFSRNI